MSIQTQQLHNTCMSLPAVRGMQSTQQQRASFCNIVASVASDVIARSNITTNSRATTRAWTFPAWGNSDPFMRRAPEPILARPVSGLLGPYYPSGQDSYCETSGPLYNVNGKTHTVTRCTDRLGEIYHLARDSDGNIANVARQAGRSDITRIRDCEPISINNQLATCVRGT